jgi:hypothetical protein
MYFRSRLKNQRVNLSPQLTDVPLRSKIRTRHHPNAQIILHLADDLDGVVELEV